MSKASLAACAGGGGLPSPVRLCRSVKLPCLSPNALYSTQLEVNANLSLEVTLSWVVADPTHLRLSIASRISKKAELRKSHWHRKTKTLCPTSDNLAYLFKSKQITVLASCRQLYNSNNTCTAYSAGRLSRRS